TPYICSLVVLPRPPSSTLFPYTTLFRSSSGSVHLGIFTRVSRGMLTTDMLLRSADRCTSICTSASGVEPNVSRAPPSCWFSLVRSEEHTSELQSRENLVCRLLLEKKKTR